MTTPQPRRRGIRGLLLFLALGVPTLLFANSVRHELVNRRLDEAVRNRDLAGTRAALESGADPDLRRARMEPIGAPTSFLEMLRALFIKAPTSSGPMRQRVTATMLMMASDLGPPELARLLLVHGAHPDLPQPSSSPLISAAARGDVAMIDVLLDHGANVNARARDGRTAVAAAIMGGRDPVLQELLRRGADLYAGAREAMNSATGRLAAQWPNGGGLGTYIVPGARMEPIGSTVPAGPSTHANAPSLSAAPLILALRSGASGNMVRMLLKAGCDPRACDADGTPALVLAERSNLIEHRQVNHPEEAVMALLDAGADVNVRAPDQWSPLGLAASAGNVDLVRELFAHGAKLPPHSPLAQPLITLAVMSGSVDTVKLLLAHGLDVRETDATGMTALMTAVESSPTRVTYTLNGVTTTRYQDPMTAARMGRYVEIVRLLLGRGVDPEAVDRAGNTAAQLAKGVRRFWFPPGAKVPLSSRVQTVPSRPEMLAVLKAAGVRAPPGGW